MSATRVRLFCRPTRATFPVAQRRLASSDSNSHNELPSIYPPEGFNTPFWRNTLILAILGIGLYNVVPYLDKDGCYIARYIQHYATPSDVWTRINDKHLEQAIHAAQGQILITGAARPPVHRLRNPGVFDNGSPHCIAVGSQADVSNVVVKTDKPWAE